MSISVIHNAQQQRFETTIDGQLCVADYRLQGHVMQMIHTEVSPLLQGRGIAAALVHAALEYARQHQLKIQPVCSYVRIYMQRHPETLDLQA